MPSFALQRWSSVRSIALDEIQNAHRSVGGTGPGRRTATLQINYAYAMLLSAHFQGFCRELHTEFADHLVASVSDLTLRSLFRSAFLINRKLDRGNPNPGNIGSDFSRFDLAFWRLIDAHRAKNSHRRAFLEELNEWRNAIAHQDFASPLLRGARPALRLSRVQTWRKVCEALARSFDEVLRGQIRALTGIDPW